MVLESFESLIFSSSETFCDPHCPLSSSFSSSLSTRKHNFLPRAAVCLLCPLALHRSTFSENFFPVPFQRWTFQSTQYKSIHLKFNTLNHEVHVRNTTCIQIQFLPEREHNPPPVHVYQETFFQLSVINLSTWGYKHPFYETLNVGKREDYGRCPE